MNYAQHQTPHSYIQPSHGEPENKGPWKTRGAILLPSMNCAVGIAFQNLTSLCDTGHDVTKTQKHRDQSEYPPSYYQVIERWMKS